MIGKCKYLLGIVLVAFFLSNITACCPADNTDCDWFSSDNGTQEEVTNDENQ